MILNTTQDILSVVRSFEDRTISKADWTHAAHLVVGFYYLQTMPFAVAKNVLRDGICWLNDKHGTLNTEHSGYHETLTVFWLKCVWNYLDELPSNWSMSSTLNELIERFNDPDLPLKYYSRERLYSAAARRDYLPPDRPFNRSLSPPVTLCTLLPLF